MKKVTPILVMLAIYPAVVNAKANHYDSRHHEVRVVVRDYAVCTVSKHYKVAKNVIISNNYNHDIIKKNPELMDGSCALAAGSMELRFPNDFFRYALAEALIQRDFSKTGPMNFNDRLPLTQPEIVKVKPVATDSRSNIQPDLASVSHAKLAIQKTLADSSVSVSYGDAILSRYGECVVRQDAVNARLWILTYPDKPEEAVHIQAMMPALQECLPPGKTLEFGKMQLRGTVALNYARLAYAAPQPNLGAAH